MPDLTQITGGVVLPDGSVPYQGRIHFTPLGWDGPAAGKVQPPATRSYALGPAGGLVDVYLSPSTTSLREMPYRVSVTHFNTATRAMETTDLGLIAVPEVAEGGSVGIRSLLSNPPSLPAAPDALAQVTAKALEVDAARAAAQAARAAAEIAAEMAQTYGARTFDSMAAFVADVTLSSANTALGRTVSVRGVGDFVRVAAGGDVTTAGGLRFVASTTTLRPEMFGTIQQAITAAAGRALVGTPGSTYVADGTSLVAPAGVDIDLTGCRVVASGGISDTTPVLEIRYPMSAATYGTADVVSGMSYVLEAFANGELYVPRLSVSPTVAAQYAAGDFVKILSADRIPANPIYWPNYRYAESHEVYRVDVSAGHIYLLQPLAEDWTPTRIVRYAPVSRVRIVGGEWSDPAGFSATRRAPMISIRGAIRPEVIRVRTEHTASIGVLFTSCYEPLHRECMHNAARSNPTAGIYGYGVLFAGGCTRPTSWGAFGENLRHVVDTGASQYSDAALDGAAPDTLGGCVRLRVFSGRGINCHNAAFNDHPDAYESIFYDCSADYAQPRSPDSTRWVAQLRGRRSGIVGGDYRGVCGVRFEPGTDDEQFISGARFVNDARHTDDANRYGLIDVVGAYVSSGRARARIEGVYVERHLGKVVGIVALDNASVSFSGAIRAVTGQSNPAIFTLSGGSTLTLGDCEIDLTQATATVPLLVDLNSASDAVFAPGRVLLRGNNGISQSVAIANFSNLGGSADFRDVVLRDCSLYSNAGNVSGWRESGSATLARLIARPADASCRASIRINFASPAGAKPITWPVGIGDPVIDVAVFPSIAGTYVGSLPNGSFVGQVLMLSNVGYESTYISGFELSNVATPVALTPSASDRRTILPGQSLRMRWSGSKWEG